MKREAACNNLVSVVFEILHRVNLKELTGSSRAATIHDTKKMKACFLVLLFTLLGPSQMVFGHGATGELEEVEFAIRQLYEVEPNQLHKLVVWHKSEEEEAHVIIVASSNCHESELAAADPHELEEMELDQLVPGESVAETSPLNGFSFETDHVGMHMFTLNLSHTCWMIVHSDATQVFLIESFTGEQVAPLFSIEMQPEKPHYGSEVAGNAAGAVVLVCCLPIVLVALFYMGASTVHQFINFGLAALFMQSFGCGALLAVSVLHIYPEMVHMLEESNVPQWKGGALILGSICILILVQFVSSVFHDHNHMMHSNHETDPPEDSPKAADVVLEETGDVENKIVDPSVAVQQEEAAAVAAKPHTHGHSHDHHGHSHHHHHDGTEKHSSVIAKPHSEHPAVPKNFELGTFCGIFDLKTIPTVVWGLTVGDCIHNLVDGAAIASAFMTCGTSSGWIVTAAIIAHEVPQELGDLVIMVAQGATLLQACFFNFVAQLTALIGMGIVLSIGELSAQDSALMLAFGLGTFFFIALTNIMPKIVVVKTPSQFIAVATGLVLACVVIGLTLLLEESC